ncbi:MAG: hypothetical protein U0796_21085 [Gemmatales bacterium]
MNHASDIPASGLSAIADIGCNELQNYISKRVGGSVSQFQLKAADDGLILYGRAKSYYVKQLVQEAVMERTSMPILSNEIQVMLLPSS